MNETSLALLEHYALEGEEARFWYRESADTIFSRFTHPTLFIGILAATSPANTIADNTRVALMAYDAFLREGNPWPYTFRLSGRGSTSILPNLHRAVAGEPLHGLKVPEFHANLLGDLNAVSVDVWMLRAMRYTNHLTPKRYRRLRNRITKVANRLGWRPAETQAAIWAHWKTLHGKRGETGLVSYASILSDQKE